MGRTIDRAELIKVKSARSILRKVIKAAPESIHTRMIHRAVKDLDVVVSFNERRSRQGG